MSPALRLGLGGMTTVITAPEDWRIPGYPGVAVQKSLPGLINLLEPE